MLRHLLWFTALVCLVVFISECYGTEETVVSGGETAGNGNEASGQATASPATQKHTGAPSGTSKDDDNGNDNEKGNEGELEDDINIENESESELSAPSPSVSEPPSQTNDQVPTMATNDQVPTIATNDQVPSQAVSTPPSETKAETPTMGSNNEEEGGSSMTPSQTKAAETPTIGSKNEDKEEEEEGGSTPPSQTVSAAPSSQVTPAPVIKSKQDNSTSTSTTKPTTPIPTTAIPTTTKPTQKESTTSQPSTKPTTSSTPNPTKKVTQAPITPAPVTPAPVTPAPVTAAPTSAPKQATKSIYFDCNEDNNCFKRTIDCNEHAPIDENSDEDDNADIFFNCNINCMNDKSCFETNIICPRIGQCNINCDARYACARTVINGSDISYDAQMEQLEQQQTQIFSDNTTSDSIGTIMNISCAESRSCFGLTIDSKYTSVVSLISKYNKEYSNHNGGLFLNATDSKYLYIEASRQMAFQDATIYCPNDGNVFVYANEGLVLSNSIINCQHAQSIDMLITGPYALSRLITYVPTTDGDISQMSNSDLACKSGNMVNKKNVKIFSGYVSNEAIKQFNDSMSNDWKYTSQCFQTQKTRIYLVNSNGMKDSTIFRSQNDIYDIFIASNEEMAQTLGKFISDDINDDTQRIVKQNSIATIQCVDSNWQFDEKNYKNIANCHVTGSDSTAPYWHCDIDTIISNWHCKYQDSSMTNQKYIGKYLLQQSRKETKDNYTINCHNGVMCSNTNISLYTINQITAQTAQNKEIYFTVNCDGFRSCQNSLISCDNAYYCQVNCIYEQSCTNAIIEAGKGTNVMKIVCSSTQACHNIGIYGNYSQHTIVEMNNADDSTVSEDSENMYYKTYISGQYAQLLTVDINSIGHRSVKVICPKNGSVVFNANSEFDAQLSSKSINCQRASDLTVNFNNKMMNRNLNNNDKFGTTRDVLDIYVPNVPWIFEEDNDNVDNGNDNVKNNNDESYPFTSANLNPMDVATATITSNSDYFGFVTLYSECGFSNVYFQSKYKTSFDDFHLYCENPKLENSNDFTTDDEQESESNYCQLGVSNAYNKWQCQNSDKSKCLFASVSKCLDVLFPERVKEREAYYNNDNRNYNNDNNDFDYHGAFSTTNFGYMSTEPFVIPNNNNNNNNNDNNNNNNGQYSPVRERNDVVPSNNNNNNNNHNNNNNNNGQQQQGAQPNSGQAKVDTVDSGIFGGEIAIFVFGITFIICICAAIYYWRNCWGDQKQRGRYEMVHNQYY